MGALLLVRSSCSCDRADPITSHLRGTYMGSMPGQLNFDPQQGSQTFMLLTIRWHLRPWISHVNIRCLELTSCTTSDPLSTLEIVILIRLHWLFQSLSQIKKIGYISWYMYVYLCRLWQQHVQHINVNSKLGKEYISKRCRFTVIALFNRRHLLSLQARSSLATRHLI